MIFDLSWISNYHYSPCSLYVLSHSLINLSFCPVLVIVAAGKTARVGNTHLHVSHNAPDSTPYRRMQSHSTHHVSTIKVQFNSSVGGGLYEPAGSGCAGV